MISNMHHAKTHLSQLVEKALLGEEVLIAKDGKPLVKLIPIQDIPIHREFGVLQGKVWMASDCWEDDPGIWKQVENDPLFPDKP